MGTCVSLWRRGKLTKRRLGRKASARHLRCGPSLCGCLLRLAFWQTSLFIKTVSHADAQSLLWNLNLSRPVLGILINKEIDMGRVLVSPGQAPSSPFLALTRILSRFLLCLWDALFTIMWYNYRMKRSCNFQENTVFIVFVHWVLIFKVFKHNDKLAFRVTSFLSLEANPEWPANECYTLITTETHMSQKT